MSAEQHDVMTAAEVADYLQIPVRSVHDYAARDELPSVRIGRHRRFSRAAVEAVVDVSRRPQRMPARNDRPAHSPGGHEGSALSFGGPHAPWPPVSR
ncbi:MAG: helix-turn-helix domain-containing protein [Actinobacteria bacterium]|nr:MAG: helix-turn-helix domain-containing protein [Actinomycetota bacterium]